jgi:hypothetical protein
MISFESDQPGGSATYAQYQIVRREGAVVSFEPSKIHYAIAKMVFEVRGSMTDWEHLQTRFCGLLLSLFERVSVWRCQLRLLALDFKRARLVQETLIQRSGVSDVLVGVGVRRGFFSATKPNLRNAR